MKQELTREHRNDILATLKKLAGTDFCREIVRRRCEFHDLVSKVATAHGIKDKAVLGKAIDIATRRYHDNGALSKEDVSVLQKAIRQIVQVLQRGGNDKLLADLLVSREDAKIRGGKYDLIVHGKTIFAVSQMSSFLTQLERRLKDRSHAGRRPDVGLHSTVSFLEAYWRALPGKRLRRTFTPKDKRQGRPLAKSQGMKFIEEVMEFIDPTAVSKLPSVTRHRLRRLPKSAPKAAQ